MLLFEFVILLIISVQCFGESEPISESRDSYIEAYHESHGGNNEGLNYNKNDRDSKYSPFYDSSAGGSNGYPEAHYPPSNYGPPANYGPPIYGPPNHVPRYRAFPIPAIVPFYGMPHAMLGLFDKLHLKLDLITILKILLKLVIFKKIVGFIALICLLLFIPKFKMDKDEMEDSESRSILNVDSQVQSRINTLTQYVLTAVEKYSEINNEKCEGGINCDAMDRMFRDIDNKFSYQRLLTMYAKDS